MKKFKIYVFTLLCILSFEIFMTVRAAGNPYKSTGPYGINCTWYTWDKVKNIKGVSLPAWGNAKTWYNSAKGAGFKVGSEPKDNSIVVGNITEYGHVAYVEKVSGNYIYVWDSDKYCIDEEDPEFIECDSNSYDESSQAACRKNAKRAACKLETNIYTADYKTIGFIYLDEVPSNANQNDSSNKHDNNNGDKQTNQDSKNNQNNEVKKKEPEVIKSDNNYLQEIILSSGSLDFNKDILDYNVTVENEVDELEINAKTEDSKALVVGNGIYKIEVGNNLIKLDVTAENGNIKEYTINVLRKENDKEDIAWDESQDNEFKENNGNINLNLTKYLVIALGASVLLIILGVLWFKKNKKENSDK